MKGKLMPIFDSHCHLDDRSFEDDLNQVFTQAHAFNVMAVMIAGITLKSSKKAISICDKWPNCYASVGVHPHDVKRCDQKVIDRLTGLTQHPKVRAWGEIGLDFNRMYSSREIQEKWFEKQLDQAGQLDLPVIFHERDSQGRFYEMLKAHSHRSKGVVHCFSGNKDELFKYLDLGLYIGVTGIVTIQTRGENLRQLVKLVPVDRLLVETDAPYLTPAPYKNQFRRNEPAFVKAVFEKVATVRGEDFKTFEKKIWDNTCKLFDVTPQLP